MPLPLILVPAGLPCVLLSGFGITPSDMYDHVPVLQGEGRKRRRFTTAPRVVTVGWVLDDDQMTQFDDWFENALIAGTLQFTLEVQRLGPGREFWTAEFVGGDDQSPPYVADPTATKRPMWRVTGLVLLTGAPSETAPETGALALDTSVVLNGSAAPYVANALALDTSIVLNTVTPLSLETSVVLNILNNGAPPSATDFAKRWIWMRYPYARGRSADVQDVREYDQRSWFGA